MTDTVSFDLPDTVPPVASAKEEQLPAAKTSRLTDLRGKREATLAVLHTDLYVPRHTDPEVVVRYGPIDAGFMNARMEQRKKKSPRPQDWFILAYCDVLASACKGVYGEQDGQRYSLLTGEDNDPDTCRFDRDLAKVLGIDTDRAVDVVRSLYYTDGDITNALTRLAEWSGVEMPDAEEAFLSS